MGGRYGGQEVEEGQSEQRHRGEWERVDEVGGGGDGDDGADGNDGEGEPVEMMNSSAARDRISMVSGPRVTKYGDISWEDGFDIPRSNTNMSASGNIGKLLLRAAGGSSGKFRPVSPSSSFSFLAESSTKKGLSFFTASGNGATHTPLGDGVGPGRKGGFGSHPTLTPSSTSTSTQTVSTASVDERLLTPRVGSSVSNGSNSTAMRYTSTPRSDMKPQDPCRQAGLSGEKNGITHDEKTPLDPSPFPHYPSPNMIKGRPLVQSGSPGFGLISLEDVQEREKKRINRRTGLGIHSHLSTSRSHSTHDTLTARDKTVPAVPLTPHSHQKSVKTKKSLMKLFKNEKTLPPNPPAPLFPVCSSGQTIGSYGQTTRVDKPTWRGGGSVWSDVSESSTMHQNHNIAFDKPFKSDQNDLTIHDDRESLKTNRLELRPVSMNFSNKLPSNLLSTLSSSPPPPPTPLDSGKEQDGLVAEAIKEQIANARKGWMVQLFELEAQIRELKDQLAGTRSTKVINGCQVCACPCIVKQEGSNTLLKPTGGVMDRARAKTGGARGVFGSGSLYEWE